MKITIGHKVLNLEELFNVAYLGCEQVEVVVDSQLYAELSTDAPKAVATIAYKPLNEQPELEREEEVTFNVPQIRAILLVKLVQILKLKKNAQRSTVDFFVGLLNDFTKAAEGIGDGRDFFRFIKETCAPIKLSEKESFVLEAPSQAV